MHARLALRLALLCIGGGLALVSAPDALADTAASSNWSGYAVHETGVTFRRVAAAWSQPSAHCTGGQDTYSSFWVGLGGYNQASGLEQIGTELDCTPGGRQRSWAWYELVPAPSHVIGMTVSSGDQMAATVTVVGDRVTFRLTDQTRNETFARSFLASFIDVTSAEWIAEAPSMCAAPGTCQTLPLTNFGSARFDRATAQTASGHLGNISDLAWSPTRLILSQSPSPFTGLTIQRTATPSPLRNAGGAFAVRYGQSAAPGPARTAARAVGQRGTLRPGGARR